MSHLYRPKFMKERQRKSVANLVTKKNILANNVSCSLFIPKRELIKKEKISKHLGRYKGKRISLPIANFDKVQNIQEMSNMNAWWREQEEKGNQIEKEELRNRYHAAQDVKFKVHN